MIKINSVLIIGALIYLGTVCCFYCITDHRVTEVYLSMEEKRNQFDLWVNSCLVLNANYRYTSKVAEEFEMYGKKDYSSFPIKYQEFQNKIDSLNYFATALTGSSGCGIDRFYLLRDDLNQELYLCTKDRISGLCQQYEIFINGIAQATDRYNNHVILARGDSTLIEFKKYFINFQDVKLDTLIDRRMVYVE